MWVHVEVTLLRRRRCAAVHSRVVYKGCKQHQPRKRHRQGALVVTLDWYCGLKGLGADLLVFIEGRVILRHTLDFKRQRKNLFSEAWNPHGYLT